MVPKYVVVVDAKNIGATVVECFRDRATGEVLTLHTPLVDVLSIDAPAKRERADRDPDPRSRVPRFVREARDRARPLRRKR